ncbi:MAG TPA: glycosyl hydrolase family 28-related protein [Allosphingosinicella sp.]|nr:glycosyl hydrolase family 28-related protein [Allosphingosinicella sp.]
MTMQPFSRRALLGQLGAGAVATGGATAAFAQQAAPAAAPIAGRIFNVVEAGADPTGRRDSSGAFQRGIAELAPNGGTIYIPSGRYRIERTLVWENRQNARAPGLTFRGDAPHSTVLVHAAAGPLLRVRGVRATPPVNTSFFWGGGIFDLSIQGNFERPDQHGIEVLGWYYGEIHNCHFTGLGGDGIRAVVDLRTNANPDFTSSTLFVRGVWLERLGGWGFIDLSDVQGAPAWSWDRCIFSMCGKGGALVRSGGQSFTKSTFFLCGWRSEHEAPGRSGYGLYFDGNLTGSSQQFVEGCEFDTNLTAHVGARYLSASSFLNNRFIFSNRSGGQRPFPPVAVEIGSGDAHAAVRAIQLRQSFFRQDLPGSVVAFDFANHANVRDVEIGGSVFNAAPRGSITRYRGADPNGRGAAYGYVVQPGASE